MTLFWHPTGPKLSYRNGVLHVSDLNPEVSTKWTMSRSEMLALGWRCIWAAIQKDRR